MLLLYETAELANLTVNPNAVKTETNLRILLMETAQKTNFSPLRDTPGTMKVTS